MKKFKRAVQGLGAIVVVAGLALGAVMFATFNGALPQTTEPFQDGVQPIVDGYVNAFAVPLSDPTRVALVDCGNDAEAKAIKQTLAAHHWKVAAIFITHGHPDHIMGCPQLMDDHPAIYALAAEVDAIEGRRGFSSPLTQFFPARDLGVRVSNPLKDGEVVDVEGVTFKAFAVVGHTPGTAVYRARTTLFFGDAATAKKPARVVGPPWVFSDDDDAGTAALAALAQRLNDDSALQTFAFGHSGPLAADLGLLRAAAAATKP